MRGELVEERLGELMVEDKLCGKLSRRNRVPDIKPEKDEVMLKRVLRWGLWLVTCPWLMILGSIWFVAGDGWKDSAGAVFFVLGVMGTFWLVGDWK